MMNIRLFLKKRDRESGTHNLPFLFCLSLSLAWIGLLMNTASAQEAAGQGATNPSAPSGPKPKLKVDNLTHDFGTTWVDQELKHICKISNVGDAPLEIERITPGCGGCTTVGEFPRRLEPGQTGEVPLQMITSKLMGKYSKIVQIHSNDPASPVTTLTFTGECKRYIRVEPNYVGFPPIRDQQPHEQIVTITNNVEQPLKVTMDATQTPPGFKFDLTETQSGREFQLKVATVPPYKQGMMRGQVVLNTNFEGQKTIEIEFSAHVPPRLDVNPPTILLQDLAPRENRPNQTVTRIIRFTNNGEQPVKLLEATANDAALQLQVDPQADGKSYFVRVQMPQDYQPPANGAAITLKTDDEEQPTITVPIRKVVKQLTRATLQTLLGRAAPSFNLQTTGGKTITNADLNGTIALLNLVSFNDTASQQSLNMLEQLRRAYAQKGVRFIYIHQTLRDNKINDQEVLDLARKVQIEEDVVNDPENSVSQLFYVKQYPTVIVLGRDGQVKAVNEETTFLEISLQVQLNSLLADMPIPNLTALLAAAKRPAQPSASARPALELKGKPAPEFAVKTLDGKDVTSKDFANHTATVLNFVAANCGFCKKQIPQVEKLRQIYEAKGVRFVNMVQTMRTEFTAEQVTEMMNSLGSKLELVKDEKNETGKGKYKAVSYPTLVLVGRDGIVQDVIIGAKADLSETLSKELDALVAKGSTAGSP